MDRLPNKILFCEAHGERLRINNPEAELPCSLWAKALEERGFQTDRSETILTEQQLTEYAILVLSSPMERLSPSEIDAIVSFVRLGGGLLLINDGRAIRSETQNLNDLGQALFCEFREYLNASPTAVEEFRPHYVTAGLVSLTVASNCRLIPSSEARQLAVIPETGESFALCGEIGTGRAIVVADSIPFSDQHWERASNARFAVQCCRWLAQRNPVDLDNVTVDSPIELGQTGVFTLTLANPWSEPLRRVRCILEANTDTTIGEASQEIQAIPPAEQVHRRWTLRPEALGHHHLRLTVEVLSVTDSQTETLFNRVAQFVCTAPASLRLEIMDSSGRPRTSFTTGERFRIEGTMEWWADVERCNLKPELQVSDAIEVLQEEAFGDAVRWYLRGNTPGHYDVTVIIPETNQALTRGLIIRPSLDWRREHIQTEYVEPLDAEIVRRLVRVHSAFGDEPIGQIPFHVLSPEEYLRVVHPSSTTGGRLRDTLTAARRETRFNLRLLNEILLNIAPIYSTRYGVCVPFDPGFASHWVGLHPTERQSLFYNFLQLEDSNAAIIQQNVAAYLLHEKYGHGFFFAHTRLGQQMAVLDRFLFLRDEDEELLTVPYPRTIRQRYAEAIRALDHSAIIVNEGFAAWVELNFLAQMESEIAAAVHPRKVFLISNSRRLKHLEKNSPYFQQEQFRPLFDSPYKEGYEKLEAIQRAFGNRYGEKCAIQAFLKATDVSLGIKPGAEEPEFSLSPEEMLDALTNPERPEDTRSDRRLRKISNVLLDNQDQLYAEQRRLQCHRECLHPDCPVHALIAEELGW
jgi:hypothetical protein